jgi:nucleotide-binding universal stress UspA family protein
MKNVLFLAHDDPGQESRFQAALDLARALGGHLSCVDVAVPPIPADGLYDGTSTAALLEVERDREAANKTRIMERLKAEDVPWTWVDVLDTIADAVLDAAALTDVIVLNRQLDSFSYPDMRGIAGRVVMHAKKPVVAVPETLKRFELGRALVAWDGRDACAAVLRDCVPLLALAEDVEIFTVGDGSQLERPADEAAEYLSRHGIAATIREVSDKHGSADELIAAEAREWRADYIVMGAYNHGRLAQIFGGVTKRLLTESPLPLVLGR